MRIGADTYFLVLLAGEDEDAQDLFRKIALGEHELFISTICIAELSSVLLRKGQSQLAEKLKTQLVAFPSVNIVSVDLDIASDAAKRKHSLGLSICDAIILTTALIEDCDVFVAEDIDYEFAKKQNIIKIVKPAEVVSGEPI